MKNVSTPRGGFFLTHTVYRTPWAAGRSDLHNERSTPGLRIDRHGRPISSSTGWTLFGHCVHAVRLSLLFLLKATWLDLTWSQVIRGQPGRRFQSVAGGVCMLVKVANSTDISNSFECWLTVLLCLSWFYDLILCFLGLFFFVCVCSVLRVRLYNK